MNPEPATILVSDAGPILVRRITLANSIFDKNATFVVKIPQYGKTDIA